MNPLKPERRQLGHGVRLDVPAQHRLDDPSRCLKRRERVDLLPEHLSEQRQPYLNNQVKKLTLRDRGGLPSGVLLTATAAGIGWSRPGRPHSCGLGDPVIAVACSADALAFECARSLSVGA
jgi:hypothetical protein